MRRDWQIILQVLDKVESAPRIGELFEDLFPEHAESHTISRSQETELLRYHLELLSEAGFIKATFGARITIKSLTWEGHNLLDEIREHPEKFV